MKKNFILLFGLFASSIMLFTACSNEEIAPENPLTQEDEDFMLQAARLNLAAVELGKVADSISTRDSVRNFGTMMMEYYTLAQNDLISLSNNWSVTIPATPDSATLAMRQRLMLLTGTAFDTTYINAQVTGHQAAVAMYQLRVDSTKVATVRSYATKHLPTLRNHLETALRIQAMLNAE